MKLTSKIIRKLIDIKVHSTVSANDLVICEYPKSGITYFSFLLSNYLLILEQSAMRANFFNINVLVQDMHRAPSIEKSFNYKYFHGRLLKSHSSYDFIKFPQKIVLIRNPVKTLLSYYRHISNSQPDKFSTFNDFVRSRQYGIHRWIKYYIHHLSDTNPLGQALFAFENNIADPVSSLEQFCLLTGTLFCIESAKEACLNTSLKEMSLNEDTTSRVGYSKINSRFVGSVSSHSENQLEPIIFYIHDKIVNSRLIDLISPVLLNKIDIYA